VALGKSKLLKVCESLAQPDDRGRVHILPVEPAIFPSFLALPLPDDSDWIGQLLHRGPLAPYSPQIKKPFETADAMNYVCYKLDFPLLSLYFRGNGSSGVC
jgi:hypothetical protein